MAAGALVAEDRDRPVVVRDDEVRAAVVVQVADRQPARDGGRVEVRAAAGAHVLEYPPPLVVGVVEQHRQLLQRAPVGVTEDVPVDHHEVFPPVAVGVHERGAEPDPVQPDRADAGRPRPVVEQLVAEVLIERVQLALEVGHPHRRAGGAVVVADIGAHAAVVLPGIIHRGPRGQSLLLQFAAAVEEEEVVARVVADVNVGTAVAVEVRQNHSQPAPVGLKLVLRRHVAEALSVLVLEQGVDQWLELLRRTHVAGDARRLSLANRVVGERPIEVVAHVQVGEAVAVEVRPPGAGTPRDVREAEFRADRDEPPPALAVRLVVEQFHAAVAGDDEVGEPVAVVVGHRDAVRVPPRDVQPDRRGHVLELQPAEVAVQLARVAL